MKLNLGSSRSRIVGYTNVDIRPILGVDIVDDVTILSKIPDSSVNSIIAFHVLEHVAPDRVMATLSTWHKKMKVCGDISISVPDGELLIDRYLNDAPRREAYKDDPWGELVHGIFGNMAEMRVWHGDDAEKYMHHMLFSKSFLHRCLAKAGFSGITSGASVHRDCFTMKARKQ